MKKTYTVLCIILILCTGAASKTNAQANVQDSLILVDLYNSTRGENWVHQTNWLTKAPLATWHGIELNGANRVKSIYIRGNALKGHLPSSLGGLDHLEKLDLFYNSLGGSIPSSLGNLQNLITLDLSRNNLSGSIPSTIGNLKNLTGLFLTLNNLSENIPSSLGRLTKLQSLDLGYNDLSSEIPSSLGNLINLTGLQLGANQLSGSIPSTLHKLVKLESLHLLYNQLTGVIPSSLGNLKKLSSLWLSRNKLSGEIPASLGNITDLSWLELDHNQLSGSIPASFSKLTNLEVLNLSNNQLNDTVPAFLASLPELNSLYIENNFFTFDGVERLVRHDFGYFKYWPQRKIKIDKTKKMLSVYAGGKLKNNTYKWFNNGVLAATITGDSTFTTIASGNYSVEVTNAIATELTLKSDTVNFNAFTTIAQNDNAPIKQADKAGFSVYPNPAQNVVTVSFAATGKYTLQLADMNGNILQTKTGVAVNNKNMVQLNVGKYAAGVYYVTIVNERIETQTLRLNKQ